MKQTLILLLSILIFGCKNNPTNPVEQPEEVFEINGTISNWPYGDTLWALLTASSIKKYGQGGLSMCTYSLTRAPISANGSFHLSITSSTFSPIDSILVNDIGWDQSANTGTGTRTCPNINILVQSADKHSLYGEIAEHSSSVFDSPTIGDYYCNIVFSDNSGTRQDTITWIDSTSRKPELSWTKGLFITDTTTTQTSLSYKKGWNRVRHSITYKTLTNTKVFRSVENTIQYGQWNYYSENGGYRPWNRDIY